MKLKRAFRWSALIIGFAIIAFFLLRILLVPDEGTRGVYIGMFAASLFALLALLDSLGFFGKKAEEYALLEKKLTEVYSPIHAMIIAINNVVPRERALQITVGIVVLVPAELIDFDSLSLIFKRYAHVLGNHHLRQWLSIERDWVRLHGFVINKERQEWLDELESEYQQHLKELQKIRI